jgi:HD-GYP domain-containing protein (c-di-GMP phosphodiesterase class II)
MTTNRAYRRGLSVVEAVAELRSERGRQFDPRVVDVFLGLLTERPWA